MAERKTRLRPTRKPSSEDIREAVRRADEVADWIRARHPGRKFADSTGLVREDRDSRS